MSEQPPPHRRRNAPFCSGAARNGRRSAHFSCLSSLRMLGLSQQRASWCTRGPLLSQGRRLLVAGAAQASAIPTSARRPTLHGRTIWRRSVHIVIARAFTMGTQAVRSEMTEDWRLGADGRTLLIHLVGDTPRGRVESDLVFRRNVDPAN